MLETNSYGMTLLQLNPVSDAHIIIYSDLRQKIEDNPIGFPPEESLVNKEPKVH